MTPWILLLASFLYLLYKLLNSNMDYWKIRGVFDFKPLPFIGNLKDLLLHKFTFAEFMKDLYDRSEGEPYAGFYLLNKPVLLLRSPEIIKDVLQKDFDYFHSRGVTVPDHDKLSQSIMFVAKNPTWKTIRQKMTPAYTSGKLKTMYPVTNEIAETMISYITSKCHEESLDAKLIANKFATDVIARTNFGVNSRCFEDENAEFNYYKKKMLEPRFLAQLIGFFSPALTKLLKLDFMHKDVRKFYTDVMVNTLRQREGTGPRGKDMIDIMVQLKKNDTTGFWDDDVLVGQALQVIVAGTETTSQTIGFTLYELALQTDLQDRLRKEINEMIEENDGKLDYDALLSHKYLDMCVKETIRMYPALPFLDRVCNQTYTIKSKGLKIDKGISIFLSTLGLSYDEKYFPNPKKYDPERFSDMSKVNQVGLYYIPFGEGPRACIGERFGLINVKVALAYILTNFEILRCKNTDVPVKYVKTQPFIQPEGGIQLKFKKLKCTS